MRGFARSGMAAGVTIAVVGALLVGPSSSAAPLQATQVVDDGTGLAGATVLSVAPATGALELAITSGQARAETTGGLAQALARSFSLGLIGSSLTAEGCDGGDPLVEPEQLPAALRVDNRGGASRQTSSEVPLLLPVLGVGTETVSADLVPSAKASSITADAALSGLLTLGGGRSEASSTVLGTKGREAKATVRLDVDIAGIVKLTGLRWDARHRTGDERQVEGAFSIGGLEVGGVPIPLELPLESLEPVGQVINTALAPLGLQIELPRVERITTPVDLVRVTPLRLLVEDTPLSNGVGPALDLTRDFRLQLYDELIKAECSIGSLLLVADIVTGVASGTGALVLALGGVEASSADVVEENPFGDAPGLPAPSVPASPVLVGGTPITPGTVLPGELTPAAAVERGPSTRTCESTHPNGPACSVGAAGVAGIVGAVATAGLAVLDLRRRRAGAREVAS